MKKNKQFFDSIQQFFDSIQDSIGKFFSHSAKLSEDEELGFQIFQSALNNPNCIRILNTDISGKKYIVPKTYYTSRDTTSCVILNSYINKLTIVNHVHKYDILMPQRTCVIMDKMFNLKAQEERDSLEIEILKNTVESLSVVLEKFKENEIGMMTENGVL